MYIWRQHGLKNEKTEDDIYILTEATRGQLIKKSREGDFYKNSRGSRWVRKNKSSVANTVKEYNQIDMDTFWKQDILKFDIKVRGETDNYIVKVIFSGILKALRPLIKESQNNLTRDIIYGSLIKAFNSEDVKISCTCPDYKYRLAYQNSKNGYNAGEDEKRKSDITNPEDTKGAGCKHILNVLNNTEWLKNIASVINNYANYCKDKMQNNYAKFIFPKIYGMPYDDALQMTLNDYDDKGEENNALDSTTEMINLSNALGKNRGKILKGSNKNPISKKAK